SGGWFDPVVLQQVDKFTEAAVIGPVGYGFPKVRPLLLARPTFTGEQIPTAGNIGEKWCTRVLGMPKRIAAKVTRFTGNRLHAEKARLAHWQTRNISKASAAEAAIRREKRSKQALGDDDRSRNH